MDNLKIETEESLCPYCKNKVISYWTSKGCISKPEYTLIADWIFHVDCWNEQVGKYTDAR